MKKLLLLVMVMAMGVSFLAGCEDDIERNAPKPLQSQAPTSQPTAIPAENNPVDTAPQTTVPPQKQTDAPAYTGAYIGEVAAKDIALKKAGLSASEVIFERTELDKDRGIVHYEVSFQKGRTEYDADINATTGEIISWEVELDD